jgi:Holliday junction resolvase RusA-like endonuclease
MICFTLLGQPFSKANSRRLVSFGNKPANIKSQAALDYERSALAQIPNAAKQMLEGDIAVHIKIFYRTHRPDLDESLILDVLQARFAPRGKDKDRVCLRRGVYINDRQIKEKHIYHGIDARNPRAEIVIEPITSQGV